LPEALTVEERTIYALSMAQKIVVRLKGVEHVQVIEADGVEPDGPYLVLRRGDNVVAKFKESEVQGWWIESDRDR
jgi:hypothetical protein